MKGLLTYKNYGNSVKDVDVKNRVVTGYLSAFGNTDEHNDIMEKGAFQKSINERRDDIFFLNQHNWETPHGKFAVLKEDNKGLYFESEPLINTTYSNDAIKLYQAGIMTEHSIGFTTIQEDYDSKNARVLKEVKLYEGSNVTMGANRSAQFTGLKHLSVKSIDDKIKSIIAYIKNGDISDNGFRLLEISLKQLQLYSIELGKQKSLNQSNEPFNDTQGKLLEPINTINNFIKNL